MHIDPSTIDERVTDWVVDHRGSPVIGIAQAVTVLGNGLTLTVVVLIAFVVLLIRRHVAEALMVGLGSLAASGLMVVLKHAFERQRPPVADRLLTIDTYSFPSGHALTSTVVYGLIAVAAYRLSPWCREHRRILASVVVLPLAIGVTRVILGVHWTTDVLGGWLIGAVWLTLCAAVCQRLSPMRPLARVPGSDHGSGSGD